MKLIASLFLLFIFGCSSTYKLSDYSSKDRFYKEFNSSAHEGVLKVVLINDSIFYTGKGAKITNDTLFFFAEKDSGSTDILPLSRIRKISYKNHWRGFEYGFITGVMPGIFIGIAAHSSIETNMNTPPAYQFSFPAISGIVGGITGWLLGWTYTYQFNP